jgi:hypothetical protein
MRKEQLTEEINKFKKLSGLKKTILKEASGEGEIADLILRKIMRAGERSLPKDVGEFVYNGVKQTLHADRYMAMMESSTLNATEKDILKGINEKIIRKIGAEEYDKVVNDVLHRTYTNSTQRAYIKSKWYSDLQREGKISTSTMRELEGAHVGSSTSTTQPTPPPNQPTNTNTGSGLNNNNVFIPKKADYDAIENYMKVNYPNLTTRQQSEIMTKVRNLANARSLQEFEANGGRMVETQAAQMLSKDGFKVSNLKTGWLWGWIARNPGKTFLIATVVAPTIVGGGIKYLWGISKEGLGKAFSTATGIEDVSNPMKNSGIDLRTSDEIKNNSNNNSGGNTNSKRGALNDPDALPDN